MARVYGLVTAIKEQMKLIDSHCFGDCGKANLFDYVNTEMGPLVLCREQTCPHLKKQLDVPIGETSRRRDLIYLRSIK